MECHTPTLLLGTYSCTYNRTYATNDKTSDSAPRAHTTTPKVIWSNERHNHPPPSITAITKEPLHCLLLLFLLLLFDLIAIISSYQSSCLVEPQPMLPLVRTREPREREGETMPIHSSISSIHFFPLFVFFPIPSPDTHTICISLFLF